MNRKITIKIVLIITIFLILSSSLFAPIYPDELFYAFKKLEEAIRMFFLLVIIILILIIAGVVNYSYNKEEEKEKKKEKYRDYYPLMNASDNEELKRLLENGVDINAKNGDGYTALMDASSKGNLEKVKLLIENGANIEVKDNKGDTALILASYCRRLEIIKYLV